MRPEISNELLLQVIQSWDPDEAGDWFVDDEKELRWGKNQWYIRWPEGQIYSYFEGSSYYKASKLVEFLLKDRPSLDLLKEGMGAWKDGVPAGDCMRATNALWSSDPWNKGSMEPRFIVARIKSYEYLKAWKESQEGNMKIETPSVAGAMVFRPNGPKAISNFTGGESEQRLHISSEYPLSILNGSKIRLKGSVPFDMKPGQTLSLTNCGGVWYETSRTTAINPHDVTLSIDGQAIDMIPGEPIVGYSAPDEVPATYETICPHCNGSKEVTGWHGKESCQACG